MKIKKKRNRIRFKLLGDWNWLTSNMMNSEVEDRLEVIIDLTESNIVDSEGVILICKWLHLGKKVQLIRPPATLDFILKNLELTEWSILKNLSCKKKK